MEEMVIMVMEICEGLWYIYNKDMVYRDLKFENVFVSINFVIIICRIFIFIILCE